MIPRIEDLKRQTLSKTYEDLNRLLKGKSGENYDNLDDIVNNTKGLGSVEQSIRLIIIDSLRSKEGVIKALLSDDLMQIKRALKCKWFFEDPSLTPKFYETEIFPKVAYSTRCKIIHQLSKNIKESDHAEQLFICIQKNYGSKFAEALLPKCSSKFISSYIDERKPFFQNNTRTGILVKILQKFPDIVLPLLESVCHEDYPFTDNLYKFNAVLLCLAKQYPNKFMQFFEKHSSAFLAVRYLHLGTKLTRKLSAKLYKVILESDSMFLYWGTLNESILFNCLDFQCKVGYLATIIKMQKQDLSFNNWYSALSLRIGTRILPLVKYRPASERVKLLEAAFKQVFEKNLWDYPELWRIEVLEMLPLDIREYCIQILSSDEKYASIELRDNYIKNNNEKDRSTAERLLYLQRCDSSIPKLQEIVKKTPCAEKRKNLIVEMVESCAVNKDLEYLQKVCEYVAVHHRNDSNLIKSFFDVVNSKFNCKKFDLKLWCALEEIAAIFVSARDRTDNWGCDAYQEIINKYILFRLENNLCAREQVKNLVKFGAVNSFYFSKIISDMQNRNSEKFFHLFYEEVFSLIESSSFSESDINWCISAIVRKINHYNSKRKKNKIQTKNLKELLNYIDKSDKKAMNEQLVFTFHDLLIDPYLMEKFAKDFFEVSFRFYLLQYLMKRNLDFIKDSLTDILDIEVNGYFKGFLIQNRKTLDFFNLSAEITKLATEKFQSTDPFHENLNALKVYSYFADVTEFEKLIQEYEPKEHLIDYKNDTSEFLKIQMAVPELIKNMKPDSKNFEFIFKFMHGDFLKLVLNSFNSACYNSPVDIVVSILREKLDAPISVKKCILRNILEALLLRDKLYLSLDLWEKEKHYSIRTVILKSISKCFLEEPTDDLFKLVKNFLQESDEVTFEARPDIRLIPARYINEYASLVWDISEKLSSNINALNAIRNSLIESFTTTNIGALSVEFSEKVIRSGIFDDNAKLEVGKFTSYYLISNPHSLKAKLITLLNLMRERKQNKKSISFLHSLERFSLEYPEHFYEIFDAIIKFWNEIFSDVYLSDEFIRLQLYWAYHKILPSKDSKDTLNHSINFANQLKEIFEMTPDVKELYHIHCSVMKSFFADIKNSKCPLDSVLVIRQLITPPKRELAVIGILLLADLSFKVDEITETGNIPMTLDRRDNFEYIVNTLNNYKDPIVKIYFNRNQFGLRKFFDLTPPTTRPYTDWD